MWANERKPNISGSPEGLINKLTFYTNQQHTDIIIVN